VLRDCHITDSIYHSLSCEANRWSGNREIPVFYVTRRFIFHVHKRPAIIPYSEPNEFSPHTPDHSPSCNAEVKNGGAIGYFHSFICLHCIVLIKKAQRQLCLFYPSYFQTLRIRVSSVSWLILWSKYVLTETRNAATPISPYPGALSFNEKALIRFSYLLTRELWFFLVTLCSSAVPAIDLLWGLACVIHLLFHTSWVRVPHAIYFFSCVFPFDLIL
jgi:hypothetical protein